MFLESFCLDGVPWYYQNQHTLKKIIGEGEERIAIYSNELEVILKEHIIHERVITLREGTDLFMPILWKDNNEIISYSKEGYECKVWDIPDELKNIQKLRFIALRHRKRCY